MTPPPSNLPQWLHSLLESHPHSNHLEGRVTRLEVAREQQEDTNERVTERMKWLETQGATLPSRVVESAIARA